MIKQYVCGNFHHLRKDCNLCIVQSQLWQVDEFVSYAILFIYYYFTHQLTFVRKYCWYTDNLSRSFYASFKFLFPWCDVGLGCKRWVSKYLEFADWQNFAEVQRTCCTNQCNEVLRCAWSRQKFLFINCCRWSYKGIKLSPLRSIVIWNKFSNDSLFIFCVIV